MENTTANIMVSTMEVKRKWIVFSATAAVLLIGVVVYTFINTDHDGPVISIPTEDILYKETEDTAPLLAGVTAIDHVEGDVTDTVIIENIIALSNETEAKVIYAAKDSHNNITKADRIIQYEPLPEPIVEESTTDPAAREAAIRVANMIAEQAKKTPDVPTDTETGESEEGTEENEEGFDDIVAGAAAVTEGAAQEEEPEDEPEPEPAAEPEDEPAPAPEAQTAPAADAPKVTLTTKSISMYQGDAFNPYAFIASATDNGVDILHTVKTAGSVDATKVGSYTITYYAVDAEGHKSNTETLTVQVVPRQ